MKVIRLILAGALAFGSMLGLAHASSFMVLDFTIDSNQGSVVFDTGTPYGLSTSNLLLHGTATVTAGNTTISSFTAFSMDVGSRHFGLADIVGGFVFFHGDGSFDQFGANFGLHNSLFTNNTLEIMDPDGHFACDGCVTVTSVTTTPIPAGLPLFLTALAGIGLVVARKRQPGSAPA